MEEIKEAIRWTVSLGDVAQLATMIGGAWWFLRKQALSEVERNTRLDSFQESVVGRIENLESIVFAKRPNSILTLDEHTKLVSDCSEKHDNELTRIKEQTDIRLQNLEATFKEIKQKLSDMDKARDTTRETDQQRLANIESNLASLSSEVKNLAQIVPILENISKALSTMQEKK